MSDVEDQKIGNLIVTRKVNIKWECGHQLVGIEVQARRHGDQLGCPSCLIIRFLECYENDKDKLGTDWLEIVALAEKVREDHKS